MAELIEYIEAGDALLMGIFHERSHSVSDQNTAVVFWNVGVSHRVGPQRQYVDIARDLSALGFCVFRFDLGGLGDSAASTTGRRREDQELVEISAALDHL